MPDITPRHPKHEPPTHPWTVHDPRRVEFDRDGTVQGPERDDELLRDEQGNEHSDD